MSQAMAGHHVRGGFYWDGAGNYADGYTDQSLAPFGVDAQIDSAEGSNEVQRVFNFGSRTAIDQVVMLFEGSFSVSFTLTNPWWLESLIGTATEDGSTYTYTVSDPRTFGIVEAYEKTNSQRYLKGCYVTQATIDVSVEEEVTVSLEGAYADEEIDKDPVEIIEQPAVEGEPMTFVEGSITVDGETQGYVQSMSLDVTANVEPVSEMGSRTRIDTLPKVLEPSVEHTKIANTTDDSKSLEELYGGSGATSPEQRLENKVAVDLEFDNGKIAGEGIEHGTFTALGSLPTSYDESGAGDPTANLERTINRQAEDVKAEWTTDNSAPA